VTELYINSMLIIEGNRSPGPETSAIDKLYRDMSVPVYATLKGVSNSDLLN